MFNLALFNHPSTTITDQVDWMKSVFLQNDLDLTVSRNLDPERHNILIEGFSESECELVEEFCRTHHQKVSVILTEHIDLEDGLRLNFLPLGDYSRYQSYLGNAIPRFYGLCRLTPLTFSFLIVGELPDRDAARSIFPSIPVISLPYPKLNWEPSSNTESQSHEFDLCFLGTETPYRNRILTLLRCSLKERLMVGTGFSASRKNEILQSSRFNLNIPQNKDWPVISPMRVVAALQVGTRTIHCSEHDSTILEEAVFHARTVEEVLSLLESDTATPQEVLGKYNAHYTKPLGSALQNWAETAETIA